MNKKLVKLFIPPIILILKIWLNNKFKRKIYKPRVYVDLKDIEFIDEDVWNSKNWLSHVKKSLRTKINTTLPNIHEKTLIECFVMLNLLIKNNIGNICDIGGGVGVTYPIFSKAISEKFPNIKFKYHLFDSKENINIGREFLFKYENIFFL